MNQVNSCNSYAMTTARKQTSIKTQSTTAWKTINSKSINY